MTEQPYDSSANHPTDPLRTLFESTQAFYRRFGVIPQPDTAIRVFQEEVGELIEAVRQDHDRAHIAEEAADVLVTVMGLLTAADVSQDAFVDAIKRVSAKNDAKTHDTHAINVYGKIARKTNKKSDTHNHE